MHFQVEAGGKVAGPEQCAFDICHHVFCCQLELNGVPPTRLSAQEAIFDGFPARKFECRLTSANFAPSAAFDVELKAGEVVEITVKLTPLPMRSTRFLVLDAQNRPIAGAGVSEHTLSTDGIVGGIRTDASGTCEWQHRQPLGWMWVGKKEYATKAVRVPKTTDARRDITVVLSRPGNLRVLVKSELPVSWDGAKIWITPIDPRPIGAALEAAVAADGAARFQQITPGKYELVLRLSQSSFKNKIVEVTTADETEVTVDFPPLVTVHGSVIIGGQPAQFGQIQLTNSEHGNVTSALVDAAGEYTGSVRGAGEYSLRYFADDSFDETKARRIPGRTRARIVTIREDTQFDYVTSQHELSLEVLGPDGSATHAKVWTHPFGDWVAPDETGRVLFAASSPSWINLRVQARNPAMFFWPQRFELDRDRHIVLRATAAQPVKLRTSGIPWGTYREVDLLVDHAEPLRVGGGRAEVLEFALPAGSNTLCVHNTKSFAYCEVVVSSTGVSTNVLMQEGRQVFISAPPGVEVSPEAVIGVRRTDGGDCLLPAAAWRTTDDGWSAFLQPGSYSVRIPLQSGRSLVGEVVASQFDEDSDPLQTSRLKPQKLRLE